MNTVREQSLPLQTLKDQTSSSALACTHKEIGVKPPRLNVSIQHSVSPSLVNDSIFRTIKDALTEFPPELGALVREYAEVNKKQAVLEIKGILQKVPFTLTDDTLQRFQQLNEILDGEVIDIGDVNMFFQASNRMIQHQRSYESDRSIELVQETLANTLTQLSDCFPKSKIRTAFYIKSHIIIDRKIEEDGIRSDERPIRFSKILLQDAIKERFIICEDDTKPLKITHSELL
jgi:hypothetical protein